MVRTIIIMINEALPAIPIIVHTNKIVAFFQTILNGKFGIGLT